MAIDNLVLRQVYVSNELRKKGIIISPSRVRSIQLRHDIVTFQKHLKALSAKAEQEGIILDENQVATLEKTKEGNRLMGRLRPIVQVSLLPKTLIMSDILKVSGISISRQSLALIPRLNLQSYMTRRMRLLLPICLTTGLFLF